MNRTTVEGLLQQLDRLMSTTQDEQTRLIAILIFVASMAGASFAVILVIICACPWVAFQKIVAVRHYMGLQGRWRAMYRRFAPRTSTASYGMDGKVDIEQCAPDEETEKQELRSR